MSDVTDRPLTLFDDALEDTSSVAYLDRFVT